MAQLRRALTTRGTLVIVGGEGGGRLTYGLHRQLWASVLSPFVRQRLCTFIAREHRDDLVVLNELIDAGTVTPVLGQIFSLEEAPTCVPHTRVRAGDRVALRSRLSDHARGPWRRLGDEGDAVIRRGQPASRRSGSWFNRTLRFLPAIVALAMMAGCGGGDTGGADSSNESSGSNESSSDVGGGSGHWTASELCSLSDPDAVAELFPDTNVVENPGLDSPDASACVYKDADLDPLSPESNLVTIGQRDYEGTGFSDTAERREVPGADEAVFFADFDGSDASYIVTVDGQLLSVDFEIGTAGGVDFAESIVGAWITAQSTS